jgi:hypothetical protein
VGRRRALLLAVVVALATAGPADADRWRAADVQLALRVADAHWSTSPCFGGHVIQWLRGRELDAQFPQEADGNATTGVAEIGGCHVWLAWDRIDPAPVWLCTILEHEFGHNAGLEHSDDPHNVMNPWQASIAGDCRRAFARRAAGRSTARRRAAARWGARP